ncbi:Folate synthesis bifunctional protein [Forsythia ovata]|uniref:Folate synthesis bifunctional protein n=1 Tax=Forsythia ovata TaxID=205694 RepID=A0ABD1Q8K6_9LAMI
MGRTDGIRYGPRPIDLDILFYGNHTINTDILTIPHERIQERPFVMAPLVDLFGSDIDDYAIKLENIFSKRSGGLLETWEKLGGESLVGKDGMQRVVPIANQLRNLSSKTSIMGILNVTPDSFSDGGKYLSMQSAVSQVQLMLLEGADIIDLGAQSTRPMASKLSAEEELDRLIPVLEAVKVAAEAVNKGAHLVNDVSSGQLDSSMHSVVATLKVPYIAMHMRGDPSTMQNSENLEYNDVCKEVAYELYKRDYYRSGNWILEEYRAKFGHPCGIASHSSEIARRSLAVSHAPLLIGPSRKRFLGEVCGRPAAAERDPATIAAVTSGVLGGANIVRVHNVKDNRDAVKLCGAMMERKRSYPCNGKHN